MINDDSTQFRVNNSGDVNDPWVSGEPLTIRQSARPCTESAGVETRKEERRVITEEHMNQLLSVPAKEWGQVAQLSWRTLCEELAAYRWTGTSQPFPFARKWELASALQKCIRRGDGNGSRELIAMIAGTGPERTYFWRRLPVIACEDVGSGAFELTRFVVACSRTFTPKKSKDVLMTVLAFLVEKLCEASERSRTACSLACIAELAAKGNVPDHSEPEDEEIFASLTRRALLLDRPDSAWRQWQRTNDWRGARLLRFLDFQLPFPVESVEGLPSACSQLHGLPSYSYDLYTRAGREMLRQLLSGPAGAEDVRKILQSPRVKDPLIAAGEALFFAEGGYVKDEQAYACVNDLTQRLFAARFGLSTTKWEQLRGAMNRAIKSGTIDRLRAFELNMRYAQASLFTL
jgi:hypothetical protein